MRKATLGWLFFFACVVQYFYEVDLRVWIVKLLLLKSAIWQSGNLAVFRLS